MGRIKNKKTIFTSAAIIIAVIFLINIDVYIREGIDGRYRYVHMPLYVKWTQFLSRHYEYARLAKEITIGCKTDEEKALAILYWTHRNLKDVPAGMPVCDDHVLYIIIRGYGVPGQFQDVFTTLCVYAGLPAFWDNFYDKNNQTKYALSFVKIDGKWRVFDAYHGKYFKNDEGKIAAMEDILKDPSLVKGDGIEGLFIGSVPCKDFYYNIDLHKVRSGITLRPYRQMPLHRICYEMKKALGLEKEE